jgi:hypothetical protein
LRYFYFFKARWKKDSTAIVFFYKLKFINYC